MGYVKKGKRRHRRITPEQAAILRCTIANYRRAKKLMSALEVETERLMGTGTMQL
jgi:hypothetical protein